MVRRVAVAAVVLLLATVADAQSQTVKIERMDVRQSSGTIELLLAARPDPQVTEALKSPPFSRGWMVQSVETATGATRTLEVKNVIVDAALPVLTLTLAPVEPGWLDTSTHTISLTFLRSANLARAVSAPTAAAPAAVKASAFAAAPTVQLANVYFSGKITGTAGSKPRFSFEAKLQNDWRLPRHNGNLGYLVGVEADEGTNVDPDRIGAGVEYRRVLDPRPRGTILQLQPIAGEFSRRTPRSTNVLTTAHVEHVLVPTTGPPSAKFAVILFGGVEIGNNMSNAIDKDNGSGFVGRVRIATNPYVVLKAKGPFTSVKASGFWDVRFLTNEEIDPGTLDDLQQPTLTRRTRQHLKVDVDLGLNDFVSLTLQHRGGYLPPTYRKVKPTVSLSLTFKGRWI